MVSVNGKSPSKSDQKAFTKEHDTNLAFKIDERTLKVAKDDGKTLEITYQYDPASLDQDHQFLKDCLYTLHINSTTGRLERLTEKNLKDLKIKFLKATEMSTSINYRYIDKDQTYIPVDSYVMIVIKMLGNELPMMTSEKYILM